MKLSGLRKLIFCTGEVKDELSHVAIFPASHYVVDKENIKRAVNDIEKNWMSV